MGILKDPSLFISRLEIFETQDFGGTWVGTCSTTGGSQASIRHPRRGEQLRLRELRALKAARTCAVVFARAAELCRTPHSNVTSPRNVPRSSLESVGRCTSYLTCRVVVPLSQRLAVCRRTEQAVCLLETALRSMYVVSNALSLPPFLLS